MCYKDEDEKLWQEDPYEYIHMKFSESSFTSYTPLDFIYISETVMYSNLLDYKLLESGFCSWCTRCGRDLSAASLPLYLVVEEGCPPCCLILFFARPSV